MQRKTKKRQAHEKRCKVCGGSGLRPRQIGQKEVAEPVSEDCPECSGEGYVIVGA